MNYRDSGGPPSLPHSPGPSYEVQAAHERQWQYEQYCRDVGSKMILGETFKPSYDRCPTCRCLTPVGELEAGNGFCKYCQPTEQP